MTSTEVRKVGDRTSGSAISVERLEKCSKITTSIIEPIANEMSSRFVEVIGSKDEKISDLDCAMKLHSNERGRNDREGPILKFGAIVTTRRIVSSHQAQGFLTCVHENELDGMVKCNVAPCQGDVHTDISEFDLVKSSERARSRKSAIDLNNIKTNAERRHAQCTRLKK